MIPQKDAWGNWITELPIDPPTEWEDCWKCGGDGYVQDEDWQWADHWYKCDICHGEGGWEKPIA